MFSTNASSKKLSSAPELTNKNRRIDSLFRMMMDWRRNRWRVFFCWCVVLACQDPLSYWKAWSFGRSGLREELLEGEFCRFQMLKCFDLKVLDWNLWTKCFWTCDVHNTVIETDVQCFSESKQYDSSQVTNSSFTDFHNPWKKAYQNEGLQAPGWYGGWSCSFLKACLVSAFCCSLIRFVFWKDNPQGQFYSQIILFYVLR